MIDLKELKKTFIFQNKEINSGVACLLSLLQYYKDGFSITEQMEINFIMDGGKPTVNKLYAAANNLGFMAEEHTIDFNFLPMYTKPLILNVRNDDVENHFIVCYGKVGKLFVVGNPLIGVKSISKENLVKEWELVSALVLKPKLFLSMQRGLHQMRTRGY